MLDSSYIDRIKPDGEAKVLALAGGGARGLAHIGVIKALARHGWRPDLITGVSMGAIVGGIFALHNSVDKLEEATHMFVEDILQRRIGLRRLMEKEHHINMNWELGEAFLRLVTFAWATRNRGLVSERTMVRLLQEFFEDKTFADLQIPFLCLATDLYSGEPKVLDEGPLAVATAASSALPGIFEPVEIKDWLLVDGGITANVPAPRRDSRRRHWVVAVNVLPSETQTREVRNSLDVVIRTNRIIDVRTNREYLEWADDVIEPDVRTFSMFDFDEIATLIEKGEQAAEAYIETRRREDDFQQKSHSRLRDFFKRRSDQDQDQAR